MAGAAGGREATDLGSYRGLPPLTELDSSLAETVFSYIEGGDPEGAKQYAAAMSNAGLRRLRSVLYLMANTVLQEITDRTNEERM